MDRIEAPLLISLSGQASEGPEPQQHNLGERVFSYRTLNAFFALTSHKDLIGTRKDNHILRLCILFLEHASAVVTYGVKQNKVRKLPFA